MVVWKLVLVLVVGNCIVLKLVEQIFVFILVLMEIIGDLLLLGVLNVVNGFGREVGEVLVISKCIVKIVFIGLILVGVYILKCVVDNIIFFIVELGGKLLNIYFSDVMKYEDEFLSKCVEGMVLVFFNQGEVCICFLCVLIQEDMYDDFIFLVIVCIQ